MKTKRRILIGVSIGLLITLAACSSASKSGRMALKVDDSKYRVFCANGKLEVEQRTVEQEKNARGSNVCQMAEFDYLSDAEAYAEHHGGKGSDCRCD